MIGLIQVMIIVFAEQPPVYSKPRTADPPLVPPTTQPPPPPSHSNQVPPPYPTATQRKILLIFFVNECNILQDELQHLW